MNVFGRILIATALTASRKLARVFVNALASKIGAIAVSTEGLLHFSDSIRADYGFTYGGSSVSPSVHISFRDFVGCIEKASHKQAYYKLIVLCTTPSQVDAVSGLFPQSVRDVFKIDGLLDNYPDGNPLDRVVSLLGLKPDDNSFERSPRVYISKPMQGQEPKDVVDWYHAAAAYLMQNGLHPTIPSLDWDMSPVDIVREDVCSIVQSDVVLLCADRPSFGCGMELFCAQLFGKPVFSVLGTPVRNHPWIICYSDFMDNAKTTVIDPKRHCDWAIFEIKSMFASLGVAVAR